MEYRKVYFRIRSRYQFDSGWPAETDAAKFHEESRSLFQSVGWDLQPGGDSTSDTVTKGWQELYLHPMNFSGIIEMDEIPAIQELLKDAKSFCCYGFDCYERYWDMQTVRIWSEIFRNQARRRMRICVEPMPFPDAAALPMSLLQISPGAGAASR